MFFYQNAFSDVFLLWGMSTFFSRKKSLAEIYYIKKWMFFIVECTSFPR